MTQIQLKNKKLNLDKLNAFGFLEQDKGYSYTAELIDGQMELTVLVRKDGSIFTEVVDKSSGCEYILHHVASAAGSFVGQVRAEYEAVLEEISAQCFDLQVFKSKQAKEIIGFVREKYGDELEYLWQKFPNNAVVRRKDNQKWYAAILTVSRRKLGIDSDEPVEIMDLRIKPEEMNHTVDHVRYYPGYHMNKKNWYTIILDGSVPIDEIFKRIEDSYTLAIK